MQRASQKQLLDYRTRHGRIVNEALRNLLGNPSFADYDAAIGAAKKGAPHGTAAGKSRATALGSNGSSCRARHRH